MTWGVAREAPVRTVAPGQGTAEIQASYQAIHHHVRRTIESHFFAESARRAVEP